MKCVKLHVKGVDNSRTTQEDQHHTPRILITTEQVIHTMPPVENDRKNIHQISSLSICYQSLLDAGSNCGQTIMSPSHHLLHFSLQLLSWHHLSHRHSNHLSSLSSLTWSVPSPLLVSLIISLTYRLTLVLAFSHLNHHLHHSWITCIISHYIRPTARTLHHHLLLASSHVIISSSQIWQSTRKHRILQFWLHIRKLELKVGFAPRPRPAYISRHPDTNGILLFISPN